MLPVKFNAPNSNVSAFAFTFFASATGLPQSYGFCFPELSTLLLFALSKPCTPPTQDTFKISSGGGGEIRTPVQNTFLFASYSNNFYLIQPIFSPASLRRSCSSGVFGYLQAQIATKAINTAVEMIPIGLTPPVNISIRLNDIIVNIK